ncbi:MAG: type II toxin-antitoxin system VapB family antitoxin [Thermoanaerobaculia bacterium]
MRTTVRLDDDLLREAKRHAAEKGMTLTALLDQALREILASRARTPEPDRIELPSFKGRGLQPGVHLDDAAALLDLMDRDDDPV